MAKSTTLWVSLETKGKADRSRGKMSYNKHYAYLIDRVATLEKGAPAKTVVKTVESVDSDRIVRRIDSLSENVAKIKATSNGSGDTDRIIYAIDLLRKTTANLAEKVSDIAKKPAATTDVDYDRIKLLVNTEAKKVVTGSFDEMLAAVEVKIADLSEQVQKVQKASSIAANQAQNYDYCTVCGTYTTDNYHWRMHQKVPRNPFTMLV